MIGLLRHGKVWRQRNRELAARRARAGRTIELMRARFPDWTPTPQQAAQLGIRPNAVIPVGDSFRWGEVFR